MKKRIYYYDTDCGNIVYYANYLKYLEEARTEYFDSLNMSVGALAEMNVLFVVARQEIDYKHPARYGDTVEARAFVASVSRASLVFEYDVRNQDGKELIKAKTVMVCVDRDIKTKQIPVDIKMKLGMKNDK